MRAKNIFVLSALLSVSMILTACTVNIDVSSREQDKPEIPFSSSSIENMVVASNSSAEMGNDASGQKDMISPPNSTTDDFFSKNQLDEEMFFEDYLAGLCRFVYKPVGETDSLQSNDLFYFLVLSANDYAKFTNKSYVLIEDASIYSFPKAHLETLSNNLFGTRFSLEPYMDNTYFNTYGSNGDMYDNTSDNFIIGLARSAPAPVTEDSYTAGLYEILSIENSGNEIEATCKIGYTEMMGQEPQYKNLKYHFTVIYDEGIPYYQLKSVENAE